MNAGENRSITSNEMMRSDHLRRSQPPSRYEGPMAPVYLSIVGVIAWLIFILLFALYWSEGFSLFQNVIVTIVSLLVTGLLIGLMWMIWFRPTGELRRRRADVDQGAKKEEEASPH